MILINFLYDGQPIKLTRILNQHMVDIYSPCIEN